MAHFSRQKRQSRFYWAELGFMALGLLGLQPNLLTNFLYGSQTNVLTDANAYLTSQDRLTESYRTWATTYPSSLFNPIQNIVPENGLQRWPLQSYTTEYIPPSIHNQSAYSPASYASSTYAPHANVAMQPYYAPSLPTFSQPQLLPHQLPFYSHPGQSPQTTGWQNQASYLAQSNPGNQLPYVASNGNSLHTYPYGYVPGINTATSSLGNRFETGPFSLNSTPQSHNNTGYNTNNYYNYGAVPTNMSTSGPGYPNQPNGSNAGTWQRYRPSASPIYR